MKAYSDNKPTKVHVDIIGNMAHVSLSTNITQIETEDGIQYEFDYHLVKVPYRENLKQDVLDNFELWVARAKIIESKIEVTLQDRIDAVEDVLNILLGL